MATLDITIKQGKSFAQVLRWASSVKTYKPITVATKAAPCVLTVPTHAILEGWLFEVVSADGMTELNRDDSGKLANGLEWYSAIVVDANTLQLNDVVSNDYGTYIASSGSIAYYAPIDMTSFTARMAIKDAVGDVVALVSLTKANGGIVIDNILKTVTIVMTAAATALFTWESGVYDLEMIAADGVTVTELCRGNVKVIKEVTT